MLLTIIQQRSALEQALLNRESLQVLDQTNKSIKESQSIWSADKVSDLVDEMEDTKGVAREINDLIASANRFEISDDELLATLESKENTLVNQFVEMPDLPVVPTMHIPTVKSTQVDMLRELEAI
jgi:hypothetical protein